MKKCLSLLLTLCLLCCLVPAASAYEMGEGWQFDLSGFLDDEENCRYVGFMLDYHLRTNTAVQEALDNGCVALFFFEGCSDNMADPALSDIFYYRVSAVCVGVKLNGSGEPIVVYFNENCSTLPDRPLEYGAWHLPEVGSVGPATICDGTYEIYSVRHGGVYEALHLRTSYEDATIDAVYMHPEGHTFTRANQINIHTRTGNHTIEGAMWSAGCLLVGDGDWGQYSELMASTYYTIYDKFDIGKWVGTVTINRQKLKDKLYPLYEDQDAVDRLLAASRHELPESYVKRCTVTETWADGKAMQTNAQTQLMTLPCSNRTDARSVPLAVLPEGETVILQSCLKNPLGNDWYQVQWEDQTGYLYSAHVKEITEPGWFARFWNAIFG